MNHGISCFQFLLTIMCFVLTPSVSAQNEKMVSFEMSECLEEKSATLDPRLISIDHTDSKSTILIKATANCEGVHNVSYTIKDDTVHLSYDQGRIVLHDSIEIDTVNSVDLDTGNSSTTIEKRVYPKSDRKEIALAWCNCCFIFRFTIHPLLPGRKYPIKLLDQEVVPLD